jgi:hypothetical protein
MIAEGIWQTARRLASTALIAGSVLVLAGQPLVPAALAQEAVPNPAANRATCQYSATQRMAQVNDPSIREASGLVASQQFPNVYWTLNDSGNSASIFAFGQDGAPLGAFRVPGAGNVDWEALQLGPDGDGGHALYIGDVGDNDHLRRRLSIYRVPEPEPVSGGGETTPATVFTFSYPGLYHNTEAMLVHPITGEIVLITRETSGVSLIFRLPLPLDSDNLMVAEFVDVIDVRTFDPTSNQITDAAISSDGRHVALRTYTSVLMFDVPEKGELDAIWAQQPRVYRLADGRKGEGLTFKLGTDDLMSVGEERPTALYQTSWQC